MGEWHVRADTIEQLREEVIRYFEHRREWAAGHAATDDEPTGIAWDATVRCYRDAVDFWRRVEIESAHDDTTQHTTNKRN